MADCRIYKNQYKKTFPQRGESTRRECKQSEPISVSQGEVKSILFEIFIDFPHRLLPGLIKIDICCVPHSPLQPQPFSAFLKLPAKK